jgi:hypothetical protein
VRLQEAYLRAGNLIEEADQLNATRLRFIANEEAKNGQTQ